MIDSKDALKQSDAVVDKTLYDVNQAIGKATVKGLYRVNVDSLTGTQLKRLRSLGYKVDKLTGEDVINWGRWVGQDK